MGQKIDLQKLEKDTRRFGCANCVFLDKEQKQTHGELYIYGCERNGRCVGWARKDTELKTMGCSDRNKLKPGDVFIVETVLWAKVTLLYCGKVVHNGKPGYLCYMKHTTSPNGPDRPCYYVYGAYDLCDTFRTIQIVHQNEAQHEASRRIAKKRKQKWRETHGKEKG